jgi:hypothetical protein
VKKIEVPLYAKSDRRGRPIKYNYDGFLNPKTTFIVIEGKGIEYYNSIRSTLSRWKKLHKMDGKFQFDYHKRSEKAPQHWVVWRK